MEITKDGRKTLFKDFIWSKNTYRLDRIVLEPGNRVLGYLQDGPDRAFVREELMPLRVLRHLLIG